MILVKFDFVEPFVTFGQLLDEPAVTSVQ